MFKNMKKIGIVLLAANLLICGIPSLSMADKIEKQKVTPSGIAYISIGDEVDNFIEERNEGLAGCSVAILDGDKTIYRQDYGMSDMEKGIMIDEDTVYEWGSISKLLIWVSVMQLHEEGKLDFETDISEYLPEDFLSKRKYSDKITILNLMNHNAGWQETTYDVEVSNPKDIVSLEEALIGSQPSQVYHPGEITAYSNWGSTLAAFIVERISGTPYKQYVREHIFETLGMYHTSIAADFSDNQWVKIQREKLKCYSITLYNKESFGNCISYILLYPAGSATGTMDDLIKFAKAFTLKGQISPFFKDENTLKTMLSASSYYGNSSSTTGLERNFHGLWSMEYATQVKGHAGNTSGCSANLLFDDKTGLAVLVMANEMGESAFCYGIPGLIFGQYSSKTNDNGSMDKDIHGIYQNMRTIQKGFLKFGSYTGNLFPISKTGVEGTYKLSIGDGTLALVDDDTYLYDNENQYLYKNEKGEVYLQQFTSDYKQANPVYFWLNILLLAAAILSVFIAMFMSLFLILSWSMRKFKGTKELDKNKYENIVNILQKANLIAIVTIGLLCFQYLIKPLDGGELIRSSVQWKCILNGILSLVSVVFAAVLVIYWKQIKKHKKMYAFSAILGVILTFNFWYWGWYNFIC